MRASFVTFPSTTAVALLLVRFAGSAFADSPELPENASLPRYVFQVGEILEYESKGEFRYEQGIHGSEATWKIVVLRKNEDGSHRLLLQLRSQSVHEGNKSAETHNLGYCDIFPDGRIIENDSLQYRISPRSVFPMLPTELIAAKSGWTSRSEMNDTEHRYAVKGFEPARREWIFEDHPDMAFNKIYGMDSHTRYTFDGKAGRVTAAESDYTQNWGFVGKGTGSAKLVKIDSLDPATVDSLAKDLDIHQKAVAEFRKATSETNRGIAWGARKRYDDATMAFNALRDSIKSPEILAQFDGDIARHKQYADHAVREAMERAAVVGRKSPDWDLKDLQGNQISLESLRGKVVVLDFWYRGCGWCIRCMPQLNALAGDFRDQPVALLGMNSDRNLDDAKFVADAMNLAYPTLQAEGIAAKYGIRGFPTIVIIDPKGVVRDIHVGYAQDLRKRLGDSIRLLLVQESRDAVDNPPAVDVAEPVSQKNETEEN